MWAFGNDGTFNLPPSTNGNAVIQIDGNIDLISSDSIYTFGNDGTLNLPSEIGDIKKDGVSVLGGAGIQTGSFATTGSNQFNGKQTITGSLDFGQQTGRLAKPHSSGSTDLITLWDFHNTNPSGFNYAIGAEPDHVWFTMDVNSDDGGFKFYSKDNQLLKIGGAGTIYATGSITASAFIGDGSQLYNLPSTTNWNKNKEYILRNTEQLTFSDDYILEDCALFIEGSETEIEYSPNKYFKKQGSIFIGGNLLLKNSTIENNGKISVGGEVILIGNSQITGTGTII